FGVSENQLLLIPHDGSIIIIKFLKHTETCKFEFLLPRRSGSMNRTSHLPTNDNTFDSDYYQRERQIILQLSEDITQIREKSDLMTLLSMRIKRFFYYIHSIVTLIDNDNRVYTPFIWDPASSPLKDHPDYPELIKTGFDLDEPFIQAVLAADDPVSFLLDEVIKQPRSPSFLRVNYECG